MDAPSRVAHYRILRKIGEGGMGVVYAAEDERLGRRVALKLLPEDSANPDARFRLEREARIAAGISHPLICQVFELGEWNRQPFLAMELLAGEPLTTRLNGTPLPPAEALSIALSVVEALCVLHGHGIVHRDLKPSNIFVTPTGVKVLDFGVARSLDALQATAITSPGTFVGTPQYAAPEQLSGDTVDARADLFAAGVILFEMLAGRPPFSGATLGALVHAVLYETPPVLTGSPAITAVDRVLHRALAKRPEERYPTAEALAADLRSVASLVGDERVAEARPIFRLAVVPFRLLKPDPAVDYLGMSLADALISSLSGYESLVVRSSLKTARYANTVPDLNALASDLAVDIVLTGSILRFGDRVRVNAELVTVPAGDIWWTEALQAPLDAVFDLHDELARRVVASLPLTAQDRARRPQSVTGNAKAFDLYLRGMQIRMETSSWRQARTFFDQCLQLDPTFAPAWAERGRLDRVLGKYEDPAHFARAESAFLRALDLDSDNGAAQCYYAQLEIDLGRLGSALARLLARVRQRRAEPHVYAALVQACRYAGLLEESAAAHDLARRLDPAIPTSVLHTYYMQGNYLRALDQAHQSSDPFEARVLAAMGRDDEALAAARQEEGRFAGFPMLRAFSTGLRAALEGRHAEAAEALRLFDTFGFSDGEGLFYAAEIYARLEDVDHASVLLARAVDAGFVCLPAFERDAYLIPLRESPQWVPLLERVRSGQRPVVDEFLKRGGPTLLGLSP
jgi:serine/threonine protein kinase/tetratricopeptide (TPR) repeat protein